MKGVLKPKTSYPVLKENLPGSEADEPEAESEGKMLQWMLVVAMGILGGVRGLALEVVIKRL